MHYVALISCAVLLLYIFMVAKTGQARGKYGVSAPATTGNEVFERYLRVQVNTTEQLVLFFPALWLFAYYVSDLWAAILGAVFLVGRTLYFVSYTRDPKSRTIGMVLTLFPSAIMVVGTLIGVAMNWSNW